MCRDTNISDQELVNNVIELVSKERKATIELLYSLGELDSRAIYRELGYSSLFDFCLRRLRLSEGSAYRRIAAARALKKDPEVARHLLSGELSLCGLA